MRKLEVWNSGNFQQKQSKNVLHLTKKTELSLVMWLSIVTIVARSVGLLSAYMREDVHAIRQLHCQWWSGQWHAERAENAASVHNTCLDKIVCYLQRIFNRNRKLKQQVSKLCIRIGCVFKNQSMLRSRLHSLPDMPKLGTSKFRKVVRQHTEGMMGSIILVLLEIYLAFQQWKNFENPLRIDKVNAMSLGLCVIALYKFTFDIDIDIVYVGLCIHIA